MAGLLKFKASLGYISRHSLKNKTVTKDLFVFFSRLKKIYV